MSNHIVFKVSFDGNTHRFSLEKEGLTIKKLNDTLIDIFGQSVSRCNLKYEDNDGDIITLKSDFDLKEAINVFSDSPKVVIRLQLTPRLPRRHRRCPFRRGEEEKEEPIQCEISSGLNENQSSSDEKNSYDERFNEFKNFGEKFENCIKDFMESLNNGDAKKYLDTLSEKGFMKKLLRKGIFHHPFFPRPNVAPQEPSESNEAEESKATQESPKPRFKGLFRHCMGRMKSVDVIVSQVGNKTWKVKNHTPFTWPAGCTLTYCGGDKITSENGFTIEKEVLPQEELEINFSFVAPSTPGKYISIYRLATPQGVIFGRSFRLILDVVEKEEMVEECIVEDVVVENNSSPSVEQNSSPSVEEEPMQEELKEDNGPYSDLIKKLNDMGFTDDSLSLSLLEKYGGDLMAAVDKLLSWK